MNRVMNTRFELQWRWLQSYNEADVLLFQATLLCNGSSVGLRRILQLGQEN